MDSSETIPEHARQQTRRLYPHWQRRHEAVLQWLLSHHTGKLYECARDTGYSPWHLSRIINSQHFQAVYRREIEKQRRAHTEAYCRAITGISCGQQAGTRDPAEEACAARGVKRTGAQDSFYLFLRSRTRMIRTAGTPGMAERAWTT